MIRETGRAERDRLPGFTRDRARHYVRELVRLGLIEPVPFLSHLDTDGPGAKRYALTRTGRVELAGLETEFTTELASSGVNSSQVSVDGGVNSSEGAMASSDPPHLLPLPSQRFLGVHNVRFRMVIEAPFTRPFGWVSEHKMGHRDRPGWMSRHSPFGKGVHLEEAGGAQGDPAGAAGHVLLLKFRIDAVEADGTRLGPREVEQKARSRANGIRRTLELCYGPTLSDPEPVGAPKYSIGGDPFARAQTEAGHTVHGPVGVDNTPEPGTLELDTPEKVEEYFEGIKANGVSLGAIAAKLDALLQGGSETNRQIGELAGAVNRLLERLSPPKPEGPVAPKTEPPGPGEMYA